MAQYMVNNSYACNYDAKYTYYDLEIEAEKDGMFHSEAHTVIFPAGLSEADLAAKMQEYVDKVAANFVCIAKSDILPDEADIL